MIELVVSYTTPDSLIVALCLVAALIGGGAAGIWMRLPHLRPLAYVVVVAVIVIASVRAFERVG